MTGSTALIVGMLGMIIILLVIVVMLFIFLFFVMFQDGGPFDTQGRGGGTGGEGDRTERGNVPTSPNPRQQ